MKKGQIMGVPLVLLFALIVGAFILAFGIKWGFDLVQQGDYIDLVDQLSDFENNVATFAHYDTGSAKVYELDLPSAVEYVCFYNPDISGACVKDGEACDQELEGTMGLLLSDGHNVYIFPQGEFDLSRFSLEEFQPEAGNPECISNGNSVVITAQGDYVGVTYYEP
jgi:hypothetical protein